MRDWEWVGGWGGDSIWLKTETIFFFFFAEIRWGVFHSRVKECEFFLLLSFKAKSSVYLKRLSDHSVLSENVGLSGKWLLECWGKAIVLRSVMANT